MFDFPRLEGVFRESIHHRGWLWASRLIWFVCFILFLRFQVKVSIGDIILVGFFQLVLGVILLLPDSYAKANIRLVVMAVGDYIFFVLGLSLATIRHDLDLVILFGTVFYVSGFFARSFKLLIGQTLFILALMIGLAVQRLMPIEPWLPRDNPALLGLVVGFFLSMAVYLGMLGIPVNPFITLYDKIKAILHNRRRLQDAIERLASARTLRGILMESRTGLLDGLPGAQVDLVRVQGARAGFCNPSAPDQVTEEFATDSLYGLKQCLANRDLQVAAVPAHSCRTATGELTVPVSGNPHEVYAPLFHEDGFDTSFCARVFLQRELLEDEREFIQTLRQATAGAIWSVLKMEEIQSEKKEFAARIQNQQRDGQVSRATVDLLARLNTAMDLDAAMNAIQAAVRQTVGNDCLLLFRTSTTGSVLELADLRSLDAMTINRGLMVPSANTLLGRAMGRRSIIMKSTLKEQEDSGETLADTPYYVQNNLRSLLVLPLAEADNMPPYGALVLGSKKPGYFGAEHLASLNSVQAALGFTVHRCAVQTASVRKIAEWEAFAGIGEVNGQSASREDMLVDIGRGLVEKFYYDLCRIYLHNPETNELIAYERDPDTGQRSEVRVPLGTQTMVAHACEIKSGYLATNTMRDPYCSETGSLPASRLAVPVTVNDELLGAIEVEKTGENSLSSQDLQFLTNLAPLIGLALTNLRLRERIDQSAVTDPETRLFSRRLMVERLEQELAGHTRTREPLAFLLADMNGLARLNDNQGFATGDHAVKIVAELIRTLARNSDTPARWVGDTFALLMPRTPLTEALAAGRRLSEAFRRHPKLQEYGLSLTVAVTAFPQHGQSVRQLVAACQQALAQSREGGAHIQLPAEETLSVSGKTVEVDLAALYREITGVSGEAGPHTVAALNAVISRLTEMGCNDLALGNVLARLILRLDYPGDPPALAVAVPDLARQMGEACNMNGQKQRALLLAAKVYDIGKFSIPQPVLHAPRELSPAERQTVMGHVNTAVQDILRAHKIFTPVLSFVKFHHERWDGSGYPWHLKKDEIPTESMILGILDVYLSLATDRPYRPRLAAEQARAEILAGRGRMFDADLVDVFFDVLDKAPID